MLFSNLYFLMFGYPPTSSAEFFEYQLFFGVFGVFGRGVIAAFTNRALELDKDAFGFWHAWIIAISNSKNQIANIHIKK